MAPDLMDVARSSIVTSSTPIRSLVSRFEVCVGVFLLFLGIAHVSWCQWSLPRHGTQGPHGLETGMCNWGTTLLDLVIGVVAALTLLSGLVGYRVRSKTVSWYVAQTPAMAGWGWVAYALIYSVFVYPY